MKKNHIKHATSILGIAAMLFFAGAADAQKDVARDAPTIRKIKGGGVCIQNYIDGKYDCGGKERITIPEIYGQGLRVVAVVPDVDNHGLRVMNLIIEEQ